MGNKRHEVFGMIDFLSQQNVVLVIYEMDFCYFSVQIKPVRLNQQVVLVICGVCF